MSLKSKIEAVIYASEEPVTLPQLVGLLGDEAQSELDQLAAQQASLPLNAEEGGSRTVLEAAEHEHDDLDAAVAEALEQGGYVAPAEPVAEAEPIVEAAEEEPVAPEVEGASLPEAAVGQAEIDGDASTDAAAPDQNDAQADEKKLQRERERAVREHIRRSVDTLIREYAEGDRGIEIREVASGFRMGTKPEYHDAVRGFVKSLKPPLKLTLPALETLAVVAYKQPVTAAEISEIRGVDSAGVLGGLMTRKLIATAGRKQVIGRPMLYKTTRDFLLRFGLRDIQELPSMEEFERMAGELAEQEDLPMDGIGSIVEEANARGDAEMLRGEEEAAAAAEDAETEEIETTETEDSEATTEDTEATAESAAGGNDDEEASEQVSESAGLQNGEGAGEVEVAEVSQVAEGTEEPVEG